MLLGVSVGDIFQCFHNAHHHPFRIIIHFIVPESQHLKTLRTQIYISFFIIRRIRMLATIELDNEPLLEIHEIRDVMIDGHLPPEFIWRDGIAFQQPP